MFRHIVHLHIPAFPIAVARACRPELRARPVIVASLGSERAPVISVSPEARREQIYKGMPLGRAMKVCPGLRVLPPDPERMDKACRVLADVAARYTPLWEPARPGHLYLDLTGTERLWGKAKDTAGSLRREVAYRMGVEGNLGVAGNKMVSSIASQVNPKERIVDVDHGGEALFMAPLKVGVIPGLGPFRQKMLLDELNIVRVRQLAALEIGDLTLIFGRQARLIHQRAVGIDPTPVYPTPAKPMVSEEMTFPQDENDDQKILGALYRLVEKCAYRLRERDRFPRKAALLVRFADRVESRRQIKLPHPSYWDSDLYEPLEELFFRACTRRIRVGFIRIRFWDFTPACGQLSLFHDTGPGEQKNPLIIQALDRIRKRYGEDAIGYGKGSPPANS